MNSFKTLNWQDINSKGKVKRWSKKNSSECSFKKGKKIETSPEESDLVWYLAKNTSTVVQ